MRPLSACRYLQNKSFFLAPLPEGSPELEADRDQELSTPCWCLKTHEAVGPDGDEVWITVCLRGRPCFEPEVEI